MKAISRIWQELVRRKVIPFLIAYVAACFAIIEFLDISSNRFTIPDKTFDLIYLFAAIGVPLVIVFPWIINRNRIDSEESESLKLSIPDGKKGKKVNHNLPTQLTSFIGREKESRIIRDLISEQRIVTISGSGGCGKTRLACEVSEPLLGDFRDGIWFVDLAPILTGELIPKEITEVLHILEEPGRPIVETLIDRIRDKQLLIILDNCEHLISACSEISWKLIQAVPELKILSTSREPLNIKGENVWRIPSLTLLDPKSLVNLESAYQSEAVQLFTNRARLNNPAFKLVSDNVEEVVSICNKLDGIPLALELVASRTRHMNPRIILERLANNFELATSADQQSSQRQKTLNSTIDWGYNLLTENEKLLFTRLGVFTGAFGLDAVEEICSDGKLPKSQIIELLSSLVDKSLLHTEIDPDQSMKYNFFETIRQFSFRKLQNQEMEFSMRMKHLQFYLRLARQANEERNIKQLQWLNVLKSEQDNLVAALNWSEENNTDDFVKLSGYLGWYWGWHNHFFAGLNHLESAYKIAAGQTEDYARIVANLGVMIFFTGDPERGIPLLEEGRDIWHQIKNSDEEADTMTTLALSSLTTGQIETGLKYANEGLEIAKINGNPGTINVSLSAVGQALVILKKIKETRKTAQQIMDTAESMGQPSMIRLGYHFTADCDLMEGKYKDAEKNYAVALEAAYETGNMFFACIELLGVAFALAGQSRLKKAIHLSSVSREFCRTNGIMVPEELQLPFWQEFVESYIVNAREELGTELNKKYEDAGKSMDIEDAVEYALNFEDN